MKRFLLLFCSLCLLSFKVAYGQQSGAQTLRLAQSIYEQGRLHEIPDLLSDAKIVGFSKAERVSAYRLLTLSYIYLEEPEKADVAMQKLLQTEHFFEPNPNVEPAEFMGLYKTFRTKPVFSIGGKFGANMTIPLLSNIYYVSNGAPGNGKYTGGVGTQYGIVFEKEFFGYSKKNWLRRLVFAPEIFYVSRKFDYVNSSLFSSDLNQSTSVFDQTVTLQQTWIDINPVFQFKMGKANSTSIIPYVGFGPGVSYLLDASYPMLSTRANNVGAVTGPDVSAASSYRKLVPSVIASAGLKYRFGDVYVVGEARVQFGLMNPIDPSKRTVDQSVFEYNYTPPDYKPLNFMVNIGVVFPYFKPAKLKKK